MSKRKLLIAAIAVAVLIVFGVTTINFAESEKSSKTFTVYFDTINITYGMGTTAEFELYDTEGKLLDTQSVEVAKDATDFAVTFKVPRYEMGTNFVFKLISGLDVVYAGSDTLYAGDTYTVETYCMAGDTPDNPIVVDYCYMSATPPQEDPVNVYVDGNLLELYPQARLVNDILMVPVAGVAAGMGVEDIVYDEEYNSIVLTCGKYQIIYNMGTTYTTTPDGDINIETEPIFIKGTPFVPVESLANMLMSDFSWTYEGMHIDITLSASGLVEKARQERLAEIQSERDNTVNARGIASDTNYLIWVSKADYKMRVYTGSQGNWEMIDSFLVGIGKPSTPTCVGQYRYYQYQTSWPYGGYYVGPVMRFNGGYAIHSVLMRYNGTEYDGRVGVGVSHGCVRVKHDKMVWLANTIPLYTKVYITND